MPPDLAALDIWRFLETAMLEHGSSVAVVDGETRLDYATMAARASSLASFLSGQGPVAILAPNSLPYVETYFAAAGARAVLVPVNTRLAPPEIAGILERSGARIVVASVEHEARLEEALGRGDGLRAVVWTDGEPKAWPAGGSLSYEQVVSSGRTVHPAPVDPDAPAHVYFTSGTTGRPKGVVLTHRNVCVHARAAAETLGISSTDVWAHIAPMFHLADAWATFAVTLAGGRHAMLRRFDPAAALSLFERERVTVTNLIPTMLNLMVKLDGAGSYDTRCLRLLLSGGAPISPDLVGRILDLFGCQYVQTYGMTETSPYLTLGILPGHLEALPRPERIRIMARTGRPWSVVDLEVVDAHGVPVPRDGATVGEIRARGPTVTPGYLDDPEETARAFQDGWLMTGDLAVVHPDGFLDIVDRRKDVIITGGENVYSIEVENAIYEHPAVLEAAVVGVPDDTWGEAVCAVVALREGCRASEEDLTLHLRSRIASYKVPRLVRFVDSLPRTGSGKIDKKKLC